MAAKQRRLTRLASTAIRFTGAIVIALTGASLLGANAQAGPAATAMVALGDVASQLTIMSSSVTASWHRHSRYGRRHAIARFRHARAARIRAARAQLAHMTRRGQEFCLATAVYFEARDEPIRGQHAVAAVILARTHTPGRPKTVCGVVFQGAWRTTGCQFSFACDGRPDKPHWYARWVRAKQSAAYVWRHQRSTRHIVRGATFYHTKFVHPRWDRQMIRVARIGLHYFYRPRRGRYS